MSLPFFLELLDFGPSGAAAGGALFSAAVSVAFAALALVFFSVLGLSAIWFSGGVELQPAHFFRITSVDCH
jgi:hypothetical protein